MKQPHNPSTTKLPGVGVRLDVADTDGRPLHVVRRRSGHVELHADGDVTELDPVTASTIGAFISGHFTMSPEVAERLGDVLGGLVFDWFRLEPDDAAVGRSIEELAVRRRSGVTIVAILRGSIPIIAPDPSMRFEGGDDLVIACAEKDLDRFARFMAEGR